MSAALLSIYEKSLAFTNPSGGNDPVRKAWDWTRQIQNVPVSNPQSQSFSLAPGASLSVFSALLSTAIDTTTHVTMTQPAALPTVYRFTIVAGAGAFRTDRSLTLSTNTITVTVNANSTATWAITTGSGTWGSVVVGDTVFIPGVSTGDSAGPFNITNEGWWTVLALNSSTSLTLGRPGLFQGVSQVVAVSANSQVDAFSAAGIQPGNFLNISAQFSAAVQGTYTVYAVTPGWIEVISTVPLPIQTNITQTATSMLFYSTTKRFTRVESDQQVTVQYNGDSSNVNLVTPFVAGSSNLIGWVEKVGTVYQLVVVNNSLVQANLSVFSAE